MEEKSLGRTSFFIVAMLYNVIYSRIFYNLLCIMYLLYIISRHTFCLSLKSRKVKIKTNTKIKLSLIFTTLTLLSIIK